MPEKSRRSVIASIGGISSLALGVGTVSATAKDSNQERIPIDTSGIEGLDEAYVDVSGDQRMTVVRGTLTPSERASNAIGAVYSINVTESRANGSVKSVSPSITKQDVAPQFSSNNTTSESGTTSSSTEVVTPSGVKNGSDSGRDPTNNYEGGAFVTHHDMHGTMTMAKSEHHLSWEETSGEVDWIWRGERSENGVEWSGETELKDVDWSGDTVVSRVAGNYQHMTLDATIDHRVNITGNPNGEMGWETIWWCTNPGSEWGYNTGHYKENRMR